MALAHEEDHFLALREKALTRELGVRWLHVPIVDDLRIGRGKTVSELLELAADSLNDPRNHPIYFHCHHGINRSSMAQMAWRTKHYGWSVTQAADEIANTLCRMFVPPLEDYQQVERFYETIVLPMRESDPGCFAPSIA